MLHSAKRDLRILEKKGLLKRTHGGAISNKKTDWGDCHSLSAKERAIDIKENYLVIAKKAVAMIEPRDVIYVTHASIGYLFVKNIPQNLCCTIVTNSISIAEELRANKNIT